jgi:ABC-type glutathione transport system ATPase component
MTAPTVDSDLAALRHAAVAAYRISKAFGRNQVLDAVTLSVNAGETVALVGESGSGKSTLGRIIVGLERPDTGRILAGGRPVPMGTRRGVGMIFQDPYDAIDPRFHVGDVVGEPLGLRADREKVVAMLESVGLGHLDPGSRIGHLSGGQRQRLCIARALIADPDVIVCDEPTASLDAVTRAQVLDLLARLQQRTGVGVLLITHDLDIASRFADRVAVLEGGKIVEEGPAAAVRADPQHPHTRRLFASELASHPRGRADPRTGG